MRGGTPVRYLPLIGHVVPTLVVGFGVVIPGSCIAGWNEFTVGFGLSVVGTCLAYEMGLRTLSRQARGGDGHASSSLIAPQVPRRRGHGRP